MFCHISTGPFYTIQDSHIRVHSNIKKTHHNRSILSHTDIVGGSKLMVLRLSNDVIIAYMYIKLLSRCKKVYDISLKISTSCSVKNDVI